jgi:DNA-binding CsgD family transcriptional regulator/sugar-specific transcriptional regulator TrmB
MSSTVIPALTRFGLSADADLLYRALMLLGPAESRRLARELGLPVRRTEVALDELSAAGAVIVAAQIWSAQPPDEVVQRLRGRPRTPAGPGERWRRHFAVLEGLDPRPPADLAVRRWPTRALARRRAAELVSVERKEHLALNNEVVMSAESYSAARPLDQSLVSRGIQMRVIERTRPNEEDGVPGGMYRQLDEPPLKLMVFDRRVALFPADPLDLERGYIEVSDGPFMEALCAYYEHLWSQSRDPFRRGVVAVNLTPRENALVILLARGHTDQSAAAELGLSPRTVAYTLRALMDRVGVRNRFQLALVLGAAGAVTHHQPDEEDQ